MNDVKAWHEIRPEDAVDIDLTERLDISAPLNENGERCPWPWDPQQLVGAPLGQYHCPYCGAMCIAGVPHPDYAVSDLEPIDEAKAQALLEESVQRGDAGAIELQRMIADWYARRTRDE